LLDSYTSISKWSTKGTQEKKKAGGMFFSPNIPLAFPFCNNETTSTAMLWAAGRNFLRMEKNHWAVAWHGEALRSSVTLKPVPLGSSTFHGVL
jgi:hypothetical protein